MKTTATTLLVLVALAAGLGGGFLLGKNCPRGCAIPCGDERQKAMADYASLREKSLPLPESVDFRTNTIKQLAFWRGFAMTYDYWTTHEWRQGVRNPCVDFKDPCWYDFPDRQKGWELAESLFSLRNGPAPLAAADAPQWIATNYARFYGEADANVRTLNDAKK